MLPFHQFGQAGNQLRAVNVFICDFFAGSMDDKGVCRFLVRSQEKNLTRFGINQHLPISRVTESFFRTPGNLQAACLTSIECKSDAIPHELYWRDFIGREIESIVFFRVHIFSFLSLCDVGEAFRVFFGVDDELIGIFVFLGYTVVQNLE